MIEPIKKPEFTLSIIVGYCFLLIIVEYILGLLLDKIIVGFDIHINYPLIDTLIMNNITQVSMLVFILLIKNYHQIKIPICNYSINYTLINYTIIFTIAFMFLLSEIYYLLSYLFNDYSNYIDYLMPIIKYEGIKGLILAIFIIAITPAFIEEIFFRGLIQKQLSIKYDNKLAILVSSFLFAFMHFDLANFIPLFLFSLTVGYIYIKTNNLLYSMVIHLTYNFLIVMLIRYNIDEQYLNPPNDSLIPVNFKILIVSLLFSSWFAYLIYKLKITDVKNNTLN